MLLNYVVSSDKYKNINQILIQEFNLSARLQRKLILSKQIFCNNIFVDTRSLVKVGDIISVNLNFEEDNDNIVPTQIELNIVYEDDCFLILNKPVGIAVHPSMLHYNDSLSNGVKFYFDEINLHKKIRPVNRLDFNTSGLIVFAKNEYVQECLIKQMANKEFTKEYLAIVNGIFDKKSGIIDLPIARKENSIIERCVSKSGQNAITEYEVLQEYDNMSLVKCILKTGRTHQIRVHMSAIGHPLIGDSLYGSVSNLIDRQALHSYKISFIHPISKKRITLLSDIPLDMKKVLSI